MKTVIALVSLLASTPVLACEVVATVAPYKDLSGVKVERKAGKPNKNYQLCSGDMVTQITGKQYSIVYMDSVGKEQLNEGKAVKVNEIDECGIACKLANVIKQFTLTKKGDVTSAALSRDQAQTQAIEMGKVFVPYDLAEGPKSPFMLMEGRKQVRLSWLGKDGEYKVELAQGDKIVTKSTEAKHKLIDISEFDQSQDIDLTISSDGLKPYKKIIRFAGYNEIKPIKSRQLFGYYSRMLLGDNNWSLEILSDLHESNNVDLEYLRNNLEFDANFINKLFDSHSTLTR